MRHVVLVEGESDRAAVLALTQRFAIERVEVRSVGGATNMGNHLAEVMPTGARLSGLVDATEAPVIASYLERIGVAGSVTPADLADHGFFVCDRDLEDEMIRVLGPDRIFRIFEEQGDLARFGTFRTQPGWRGRPVPDQIHRFLGTRSGRKIRYGRLLAEALADKLPAPLRDLIDRLA